MRWNTCRLTALAIAATALPLLAGCATQPEASKEVVIKPMPVLEGGLQDLYARVEWIDLDPHAAVARVDGYRHTLSERRRELGPSARRHRLQSGGVATADNSQNPGARAGQAGDGPAGGMVEHVPIASAWLTYCDPRAPMSAADWAYIKSHGGITAVPEAIADTCVYRK